MFSIMSDCRDNQLKKSQFGTLDHFAKNVTKNATHSNDVPTKIVKANADLFSIFVSNAFNESVISCKFLYVLKLADVTPVHKRN